MCPIEGHTSNFMVYFLHSLMIMKKQCYCSSPTKSLVLLSHKSNLTLTMLCFSIRASLDTGMSMYLCVSSNDYEEAVISIYNLRVYQSCCTARVNTLRLRLNGGHFPDYIFKCISSNGNIWISITISLKFVPKSSINNIPALVQMIA